MREYTVADGHWLIFLNMLHAIWLAIDNCHQFKRKKVLFETFSLADYSYIQCPCFQIFCEENSLHFQLTTFNVFNYLMNFCGKYCSYTITQPGILVCETKKACSNYWSSAFLRKASYETWKRGEAKFPEKFPF